MQPINFITPWPSQRNGIADYSYELSKNMNRRHNIITECIKPAIGSDIADIFHPNDVNAALLLSHGTNVFHFGNNPDHIFAVPLFLRYGGYAVVHDVSLHYLAELTDLLVPGFFQHYLKQEQPDVADRLIELWSKSGRKISADYKEINILSWLATARGLIVHSHYAANIVRSYNPLNPVHVIPHFAYQFSMTDETMRMHASSFRERHGLGDDVFIISSAGFITSNKQYSSILRAIHNLPANLRNRLRFVIAGEKRISEYDIDSVVRNSGVASSVIMTDFLSERELTETLAASDLVLNLRYPTFGESSGSIARALGCGSVTLVTNTGSYAELSNEICFKVPAKLDPYLEIGNIISSCMSNSDLMTSKRRAAIRYARHNLHPKTILQQYMDVLDSGVGRG